MGENSSGNNQILIELPHQGSTAVDLVRAEIYAEAIQRGEYGQRMRDEVADYRRKRRLEAPTKNQKLIDQISITSNSLEENQKLIRTIFTNIGIDWKSYDDHTDGDQSTIACTGNMNTVRAADEIDELWYRLFDWEQSCMEAEKRHIPMIASAYMNICRNSSMSVEELKRVENSYYDSMSYLSRPGYYASYPFPKKLEDHITSSTKPGTEERKLLVEKRDTTFRLSPLMCAVFMFGLVNIDSEKTADGFKRDYKQSVHLLLKYGANPFAKDITGRTVIHYATYPLARQLRTPTLLEMAKMCIDASHHYAKVHKIVTLQGLSKIELNGRRGYCGGYDTHSGRLIVYLYGHESGTTTLLGSKPYSLKPENVFSTTNESENDTTSCDESNMLVHFETRNKVSPTSALYTATFHGERADIASFLIANGASIDFGDPSPRTLLENIIERSRKNETINSRGLNDDTPVDAIIRKEMARLDKKASKEQVGVLMDKQCSACCKINKKLLECVQCYGALYCGVQCQRSHWKNHKADCKKSKPIPLGPPRSDGLDRDVIVHCMRYVDVLDTMEPIGSYNPPNSSGESFWLKVTAYGRTTLVCCDETKSCCFVVFKECETYAAVFNLIRPNHVPLYEQMHLPSSEQGAISQTRHFRAKFDESGTCMIYPKSMRIKKSF